MKWKRGCGIGCLALFSLAVILMGAATWYSRQINREYKIVQRTEKALWAATRAPAFTAPAGSAVAPPRLAAFLSVRDSLQGDAQTLAAAAEQFGRERERSRNGGLRGFLNLLDSGSGLAPVYATYWSGRNRALLAARMSPAEYIWLYNIIYYGWLGKDPEDGRDENTVARPVTVALPDSLPAATLDLFAPHRPRLEASYHPELNPIELIFNDNGSPAE